MNVVCGNQSNPEVPRDLRQLAIAFVLRFHPVIVQFHEEIFRAENIAILRRARFRLLDVVCLNRAVDFARQTAAQSNQSCGMRRQKFLVDPRRVMETIEMRRSHQLHEIAIPGLVLS